MMRKTYTSPEVKARWNKKNYDRILLALPKGYKSKIKVRVNELEISMAGYIKNLIDRDIEKSE